VYGFQRLNNIGMASENFREEDKNYLKIWFVLYCLKLWGLTRFFIVTYAPASVLATKGMQTFLKVLLTLQSYGASGQAFWNCVLFCFFDKTVRRRLCNSLVHTDLNDRSPLLHVSRDIWVRSSFASCFKVIMCQ